MGCAGGRSPVCRGAGWAWDATGIAPWFPGSRGSLPVPAPRREARRGTGGDRGGVRGGAWRRCLPVNVSRRGRGPPASWWVVGAGARCRGRRVDGRCGEGGTSWVESGRLRQPDRGGCLTGHAGGRGSRGRRCFSFRVSRAGRPTRWTMRVRGAWSWLAIVPGLQSVDSVPRARFGRWEVGRTPVLAAGARRRVIGTKRNGINESPCRRRAEAGSVTRARTCLSRPEAGSPCRTGVVQTRERRCAP